MLVPIHFDGWCMSGLMSSSCRWSTGAEAVSVRDRRLRYCGCVQHCLARRCAEAKLSDCYFISFVEEMTLQKSSSVVLKKAPPKEKEHTVKDGMHHVVYDTNAVYDGEMTDGKWDGKGKILLPSGDYYDVYLPLLLWMHRIWLTLHLRVNGHREFGKALANIFTPVTLQCTRGSGKEV